MRRILLFVTILSVICLILPSCKGGKEEKQSYAFANESFKIFRGTNVAHWLSQSQKRGEARAAFFTEKDVKYIDSLGFDHIRLPIDEEQMWDPSGKRYDDAFALMKNCIDWCSNAGLRVVVDLHILRSHHFNEGTRPLWTVPAEQDKFIALWKDLSSFLKAYPNGLVAYEPMNEPVAEDPEQWNNLLGRLIDSVRIWEPARVLVLGSNRWQSASTFDTFRVPENDTNIILSYHFYEPFFLTHYKASWTNLKDFEGKVNYPGQIVLDGKLPEQKKVYNIDTLEYMMRKPFAMAERMKLPLYCGEFGVFMEYFPEAKLAWYRDMVAIFEKHHVAYANWNYKSTAFGIVDEHNKPFRDVTQILLGEK
jgi:endoglucanase